MKRQSLLYTTVILDTLLGFNLNGINQATRSKLRVEQVVQIPTLSTAHGSAEYSLDEDQQQHETTRNVRDSQNEHLYYCNESSGSRDENGLDAMPQRKTLLPPWLAVLQEQDLEMKLARLRSSLERSYMTNEETDDVIRALEMSCNGDPVKMSGVASLCLPLVEFMEMGRDTIAAAVFHYNSCLSARASSFSSASDLLNVPVPEIDETAYIIPLAGSGVEQFGEDVAKIALNAAKIKRTEVLSRKSVHSHNYREEAENLRGMLLTVTNDWRSLAIRANASLFRMRGLLQARSTSSIPTSLKEAAKRAQRYQPLTKDDVREANEALYVYAPLMHRLGMHRLKSELEATAFELLYRRQFATVQSMYTHEGSSESHNDSDDRNRRRLSLEEIDSKRTTSNYSLFPHYFQSSSTSTSYSNVGEGMHDVLNEVIVRVKTYLREDETFMNSIAKASVMARVKEPFSLWKKVIKMRARGMSERQKLRECENYLGDDAQLRYRKWSVFDVNDLCALRIIITARNKVPGENVDEIRNRERALCYYVQDLCAERWPPTDETRSKDYIMNPKANGYQSLHFSTIMDWHGERWPFEIQVRSDEMHRVAEYGLASHWNYKIGVGESLDRPKHHYDGYVRYIEALNKDDNFASFSTKNAKSPALPTYSFEEELDQRMRIQRAQEFEARLMPYLSAVSEARSGLHRESIFVFLLPLSGSRAGGVLSLPMGACILDAMHETRKRYGDDAQWTELLSKRDLSLFCNGEPATLTQRLRTGDVLKIAG